MASFMATIALLCQVHPNGGLPYTIPDVDRAQLKCQKYYIDCLDKKASRLIQNGIHLMECVQERQ